MRTLQITLGFIFIIVGAAFVASAVSDLISGKSNSTTSGLVAVVVLLSGLSVSGGLLVRRNLRQSPSAVPRTAAEREQAVLSLAESKHGRLTVAEVAADCHLSLDDGKKALDTFVLQGAAEMLISHGGVLVYSFPGFLSDDAKAEAEEL